MISSERPSEKYSFSWSALMLVKGRTAMEGVSAAVVSTAARAVPRSVTDW
jgi:hypothetical protein